MLTLLQETFAPECDARGSVGAIEDLLVRLPEDQLTKFRGLLRLFDSPLLGLMLLGRPRAFVHLRSDERERLLLAMSDSRLALLRTAFQSLKRPCTFMAYAAVDARGRNPLWPVVGYPGPRSDDGHAPLPAFVEDLSQSEPDKHGFVRLSADAVVVGSGAGGGVAAGVLGAAGRSVVVLEAGPRTDNVRFNQREADAMRSFYLDSSLIATDDLGIAIAAGSCVGGGTTINLCSSLPLRSEVAAQWHAASGGIDFERTLAPHIEAVRMRLGIAPADRHNAQNGTLERGCKALGWHVAAMERNASGCGDGCGYCGFGCAYGCKRSTTATYLRDAALRGARVLAGARVERVLMDGRDAVGVAGSGERAGRAIRFRVDAPLVVVAAGALRTPGMLARSGIRNEHIGRHLHLHPSTALVAEFAEPIESWLGPAQTAYCDQFADIEDGYGVMFEAQPTHPGLGALAFPWRGARAHAASLRNMRQAAVLAVLTRDRESGRVDVGRDDRVRYRLSFCDGRHLLEGLSALAEAALAAGAERVSTLHTRPVTLRANRADARARAAFADEVRARGAGSNQLMLFSAHQMGTCRMHRDPRQGVVDERGAVHGTRGLVVADSSVFPLAAGVNPMLTIMALARRSISALASGG